MSKFEELPRSCCLTLKTTTALRNQLYQDTQATSAYNFSSLVLWPWEEEVKDGASARFATLAILIAKGLDTGQEKEPTRMESWGRKTEHSLGHLHHPVKSDGKSPKAAYMVKSKWGWFRTEIELHEWQKSPVSPASFLSVLKSGWCKHGWGKGGSQYHHREGVQFPQQHRNHELWDRESMKVR